MTPILLIVFQLLYLAWVWSESNEDAPYIRAGKGIFHKQELIARLSAGAVMWFLYCWLTALLQPDYFIAKAIGSLLVLGSQYWILFEIRLNRATGKKWWYVGTTAWLDKKFEGKELILWLGKFFVLGLGICVYYYHEMP